MASQSVPATTRKCGNPATGAKKKDPDTYTEETPRVSATTGTYTMDATTDIKPVFHSKKAYLSYARKHLKIMKSKDLRYLKNFVRQCQEKIENREIAPEKTRIDRDYFIIHRALLNSAINRLNEFSC